MKHIYTTIAIFTFILQPLLGQTGGGWLDGWDHRVRIEIDHNKIDDNLSDFPLAVMLNEANFDFSLAQADGSDIRFTSADGSTPLVFEREMHDAVGMNAVYWVRITSVSALENSVFYLYYGNNEVFDNADNEGWVWDDNFRGVWHMDNGPEYLDEIVERKNGITSIKIDDENPREVKGNIGLAQLFDGSIDEIEVARDGALRISDNITLQAWIKPEKPEGPYSEAIIIGKKRDLYQIELHYDNGNYFIKGYIGGTEVSANAFEGEYNHVVLTYDNSYLNLYVNGIRLVNNSLLNALPLTQRSYVYIGADFKGIIDEARISGIARSDAWIKADYHSGLGDLLSYDNSGFRVPHPGPQTSGVGFNLDITNARDVSGNLLSGVILVTVTSSITDEGIGGEVHNSQVTFTEGSASVPVILSELGTHNLTVVVDGITDAVTVEGVVVAGPVTWTGASNNEWNNADNWHPSVPDANSSIRIPALTNQPVISSQVDIFLMVIESGAEVTVNPGGTLGIASGGQLTIRAGGNMTAEGTLTNNAGASGLIIESNMDGTGSLIVNNTVQATVQRRVKGNVWQIVSAPVTGMTIGDFLNDPENNIFYNSNQNVHAMTHYDETIVPNGGWADYYGSSMHGTELVPGRSYLIRRRTDGVFSFRGALVPEVTGLAVHKTQSGWHSVGNPFASSFKVRGVNEGFLYANKESLDPSYAVIYIYDSANPNSYSIISNSDAAIPEGERQIINQNYLKPGQGFLIRSKDGLSKLDFEGALRSHQHGMQFFTKSASRKWPTIILNVSDNSKEATTVVTFNENMTKGLDVTYDAGLLGGDTEFRLYSRLVEGDNGVNFAIQCLPDRGFENMVIPVGFDYSNGGEVKFSTDILTLPEGANVRLEDRELEVFTDLQKDDYAVLVPQDYNGTGRFFLHIGIQITPVEPIIEPIDIEMYSFGREIFIRGMVRENATVVVYDLMGRRVREVKLQPGEMNSFTMNGSNSGIFIFHLNNGGAVHTRILYIE